MCKRERETRVVKSIESRNMIKWSDRNSMMEFTGEICQNLLVLCFWHVSSSHWIDRKNNNDDDDLLFIDRLSQQEIQSSAEEKREILIHISTRETIVSFLLCRFSSSSSSSRSSWTWTKRNSLMIELTDHLLDRERFDVGKFLRGECERRFND